MKDIYEEIEPSSLRQSICMFCGKLFIPSKYQIIKGNPLVCSISCRNKLNGNVRLKKVERICKFCGGKFYIKLSRAINGRGKYCSKNCYSRSVAIDMDKVISLKNRVNSIKELASNIGCHGVTLSKKLKKANIKIKHKLTEEHKAKISCIGRKHTDETKLKIKLAQLGEKGHNWKGGKSSSIRFQSPWKTNRKIAITRDNNTCQYCNANNKKSLDVHHKKPFRFFRNPIDAHDIDNLITLCRQCHFQYEARIILRNISVGKGCSIYDLTNLYECYLGDNVKVGRFTEIGRNVIIGNNVSIGAHCFIPEGITIEDNVFIGPHFVGTNDRFPPSIKENWQETLIKEGARIGAGVTVICGVIIGGGALVGAGSVVTKSILPYEQWAGNPAKFMKSLKKHDGKL